MNQEKINKEILTRLEKLEKVVFSNRKNIKQNKAVKKSLSDHIVGLRDRGSFKKPLAPQEVHEKLESTYHCDLIRVKVELIRLQKRGLLRKASKLIGKKKYVAYVW